MIILIIIISQISLCTRICFQKLFLTRLIRRGECKVCHTLSLDQWPRVRKSFTEIHSAFFFGDETDPKKQAVIFSVKFYQTQHCVTPSCCYFQHRPIHGSVKLKKTFSSRLLSHIFDCFMYAFKVATRQRFLFRRNSCTVILLSLPNIFLVLNWLSNFKLSNFWNHLNNTGSY